MLTEREQEVLILVAKTDAEIAANLSIGIKAVRKRMGNIYRHAGIVCKNGQHKRQLLLELLAADRTIVWTPQGSRQFPFFNRLIREREIAICTLFMGGWKQSEIAKKVKLSRRTIKWYFTKLFVRYGIKSGNKQVRLALILHRKERCAESQRVTPQATGKSESLGMSGKGARGQRLHAESVPRR